MIRRRALLGLAAGVAAPALNGAPARAQTATLRVGNVPLDSSSSIYAAQAQGFLTRAGIAVEITEFTNGGAIGSAVVGGSLDIGGVNVLSLATAHQNGVPLRIVASGSTYTTKNPTTEMLVPNGSPLKTARDLNGKTVAVNVLKGIAHISAQGWIDRNGGDSQSVKFVEVPFATMPAGLAANRYDAAVVAEPQLTESRGQARVFGKSYDGIADLWMIDGWVASESWLAANRDLARRFATAMQQAAVWANAHQDQTAVIVSQNMKIDLAVVRAMHRATFLERTNLAVVQPVIDVGARYGALKAAFPAPELFAPDAT